MVRCLFTTIISIAIVGTSMAHFVFIVPQNKGVEVVFSDDLNADENVSIDKITSLKLSARDAAGKDTEVKHAKGKHSLTADVAEGTRLVFGSIDYGVIQRGETRPALLRYFPKAILGNAAGKDITLGDKIVPVEVIPVTAGDGVRFQVMAKGKPLADAEVSLILPGDKKQKVKTDKEGRTPAVEANGKVGMWVRFVEEGKGEAGGKKYEEIRNYATLVLQVGGKATKEPAKKESTFLAPLPKAVSSLGAVVEDGYLYVYGGHTARAHSYSTESVSGKFQRLKVSDPKAKWEDLPGGPGLQGLALVAHQGKLYRIGGMQPRNKEGDKADNHSVATCASYDPATGKWTDIAALPAGRSSHDAVVVGDKIYVVGGWNMAGAAKPTWHETGLVLDLAAKEPKWESFAQPMHRRALTAAAFDRKVYMIAGLSDEGEMELTVDIYDPVKKQWSLGTSIPGPIRNGFTPASCVLDGRLYVSPTDGKVWRLDEKGKGWENVGTTQHRRFVHRMLPAGDRLVIVGGASRAGNVDAVEVIEPCCCADKPVVVNKNPGGQTVCPVMAGVPVDGESITVEYEGVKILLCCRTCEKKFKADPKAYLDVKRLPQLAKVKLPERGMKQVFCPVYKDRVVSEKDPFVMFKGKKVYLFNQSAVRRWEQDPERYADPEVLPQLTAR